jgi:hypothetical protein
MAAKITGYYSSTIVALQALPAEARFYASSISASIQAFLSGLSQPQTTRSVARSVETVRFDAKRLSAIDHRSAVLEVRLAKLKSIAPVAGKEGTH